MQKHVTHCRLLLPQTARGQSDQDTMAKPACLAPAIPLCEELIMKKRNDFVVTSVLYAKLASEAFLQEVLR
jgi:hypothetical protein